MAEESKDAKGGETAGSRPPEGGRGSEAKEPVVHSETPENSTGRIDPSAPGNTGTTPGSATL